VCGANARLEEFEANRETALVRRIWFSIKLKAGVQKSIGLGKDCRA